MSGAGPGGDEESREQRGVFGVLAALPEELGGLLAQAARRRSRAVDRIQLEIHEVEIGRTRVLACVAGVGKVLAARAAAILIAEGATRGLLVVGTCGGLRQSLRPGTFLHCTTAIQVDFAHSRSREVASDPALREAWRAVAPGPEGFFLTADRPVLSLFRRIRLARAFAGPCAADMETAAAAAVASEAGVPWASLRTVTDRASGFGGAAFRLNYPTLAGRASDTLGALFDEIDLDGHRETPVRAVSSP